MAAAVAAFRLDSPWRKLDPSARGRLLNKLADLLERDIEELAALGSLESGKLVHTSTFEVQASVAALRYVSGWADKIHGKTIPADGGVTSFTRIEPVGICLGEVEVPVKISRQKSRVSKISNLLSYLR